MKNDRSIHLLWRPPQIPTIREVKTAAMEQIIAGIPRRTLNRKQWTMFGGPLIGRGTLSTVSGPVLRPVMTSRLPICYHESNRPTRACRYPKAHHRVHTAHFEALTILLHTLHKIISFYIVCWTLAHEGYTGRLDASDLFHILFVSLTSNILLFLQPFSIPR